MSCIFKFEYDDDDKCLFYFNNAVFYVKLSEQKFHRLDYKTELVCVQEKLPYMQFKKIYISCYDNNFLIFT